MAFTPLVFLIFILACITLISATDYYKILDGWYIRTVAPILSVTCVTVDRSASDQDIRKAYKRLSRTYHPDKNKAADAEERFVEIARGA
jgi:DnaJ-related protein SCJ1